MKSEIRKLLKEQKGIHEATEKKACCQKCLYHNRQKICQIHGIKTYIEEICSHFQPLKRHKIVQGGSVSPK